MAAEGRNEGTEKDLAPEPEAPRRPHWGRRVLLGLLIAVVVAGVALFVAVQHRLEQRRLGEGAVQPPSEFVALEGSTGRTGAFTADIDFTSMATGAETISTVHDPTSAHSNFPKVLFVFPKKNTKILLQTADN